MGNAGSMCKAEGKALLILDFQEYYRLSVRTEVCQISFLKYFIKVFLKSIKTEFCFKINFDSFTS